MKNVAIENGQVKQIKEQFFRPLECAPADGGTLAILSLLST